MWKVKKLHCTSRKGKKITYDLVLTSTYIHSLSRLISGKGFKARGVAPFSKVLQKLYENNLNLYVNFETVSEKLKRKLHKKLLSCRLEKLKIKNMFFNDGKQGKSKILSLNIGNC